MSYNKNNIFAKILRGEIPCKKVYENEYVLSFYDINPQKKIHVLVVPKGEYIDLDDFVQKASDKEIIEFYEVYKVPHILLLHPHKEDLEYIKAPRAVTIAKVLSAYEEYYQRLFSTEQRKAFNEIEVSLQ